MKIMKIPITVKEVSYRLEIEVAKLLEIHKKVSNPDFEADLIKNTGIGWKQVKNYKNHPKQFQIVRDNAKIIEFVERSRFDDNLFKLKSSAFFNHMTEFLNFYSDSNRNQCVPSNRCE